MPTLLQVNTTLNAGSTGRIAEQISLLAEKQGWDCYIAHGARYVNTSKIKTIKIGTRFGNILHAVKGEFLGMHGFGSTIATYLFIRRIKKLKPDIIHLHNIHGYYLNIKVLFEFLVKADIPVVWTLHDCWSFTGHCAHFEKIGCEKWKTECGNCPLLMAQYKSRIVDRSKKNFLIKKSLYSNVHNMTIVPVSSWLGELVSQSILSQHHINVINNGIDLNIFRPCVNNVKNKLGIDSEKIIILGVSSDFGPEKGKYEFTEFADITKYQVVMIGLTGGQRKGLPDNIIFIDRTNSQKELAEYYSAADVFLNPTYNDTFPTTNIEALACGTPVVTYQTGGSPETIDEDTGIVVPKGDIDALKVAIEEVISNGKQHYSDKCRQRAEKYFNKDERFLDYIELYKKLIEEK